MKEKPNPSSTRFHPSAFILPPCFSGGLCATLLYFQTEALENATVSGEQTYYERRSLPLTTGAGR
jgi:hypothetical protein